MSFDKIFDLTAGVYFHFSYYTPEYIFLELEKLLALITYIWVTRAQKKRLTSKVLTMNDRERSISLRGNPR